MIIFYYDNNICVQTLYHCHVQSDEQLSKLASLFPLPICQSLNILYALFVESRVNFCMQSSNNLLYSSALFAGRKTILAACIFHIYPETVLLWQTVVKGLCSCLLLHTSPRKSYFWILNNTYSNYILIQDKLLLLCSELNICLPLNQNSHIHVNLLSPFLKLFKTLVVRVLSDLKHSRCAFVFYI